PMSDFLYELFLRRKQFKMNEFVFPSPSKTGHVIDPRKAMLKVEEASLKGMKVNLMTVYINSH
ncbi:hypothetical protein MXE00_15930, partial [Legionella pneumophila]|nr:hypothetical protein [Legionella pneumophila]